MVGRISLTGEPGYELYLRPEDLVSVYGKLKSAAQDMGYELRTYGIYALLSLRLEKSYGIWSREFSPDYHTGCLRAGWFCRLRQTGICRAQCGVRDRDAGPAQKLVTLEIDTEKPKPVVLNRSGPLTRSPAIPHQAGTGIRQGKVLPWATCIMTIFPSKKSWRYRFSENAGARQLDAPARSRLSSLTTNEPN